MITDVDEFLSEPSGYRMDTKIACMFFDKSEYKDEIKDIK